MSEGMASVKEPGIMIRPLEAVEEMGIGVDLQRSVWGYAEIDTKPDQIFIVARESGGYIPNFYGRTSSPLHGGLPTDRLVAEWRVRSARARDLLDGKIPKAGSDRVRIQVPAGIREITRSNRAEAEKMQTGVRTQF